MDWCFTVVDRTFEGQHIRHFPNATDSDDYAVTLHAKQYIPKWNLDPEPGDATLICAHANGFWKELYEAFIHDLLMELRQRGVGIRSIWMSDFWTQGTSGQLNETHMGGDPSYSDHARDLLTMTNTYRHLMPRPLFGIGHSMGGNQLVDLSVMHPRLLDGLALVDPIIDGQSPAINKQTLTKTIPFKLNRRDIWDSEEAAIAELEHSPLLRGWDERVRRLFFATVLRPTPTALYPNEVGKVTLRTTTHSDIMLDMRFNQHGHGLDGSMTAQGRKTHADIDPESHLVAPLYNASPRKALAQLEMLHPPVFIIVGRDSNFDTKKNLPQMEEQAGVGVGGSGGKACGAVASIELEGGHFLPMEKPQDLARETAAWLGLRWGQVRQADVERDLARRNLTYFERAGISDERVRVSLAWDGVPWKKAPNTNKL